MFSYLLDKYTLQMHLQGLSFKPQGEHVPRNDITDKFADAVCDKLGKGVMYVMSQEQGKRTAKKTKMATEKATDLTGDQE
jgi:hypothetical protein